MKTVIFFRHAKSDWRAPLDADHERPINKRGREAAERMGRFLRETGQIPDQVVTSSAIRARTTVDLACQTGAWECPIRVTEKLYSAQPGEVLEEMHEEPPATGILLLAGHEPTWSETIGLLIGEAAVRFPTAAMARIDLAVNNWNQVEAGKGELIWLVTPKLLKKLST